MIRLGFRVLLTSVGLQPDLGRLLQAEEGRAMDLQS